MPAQKDRCQLYLLNDRQLTLHFKTYLATAIYVQQNSIYSEIIVVAVAAAVVVDRTGIVVVTNK